MLSFRALLVLAALALHQSKARSGKIDVLDANISLSVHEHWMRHAISVVQQANHSPCPFAAFGSVVVNHTASIPDGLGDLICTGANAVGSTGNPTLHGEVANINNCTAMLSDPSGVYHLTPAEITEAWKSLTLYTTGEPCGMCANAIRWAGFRAVVYGTSIPTLMEYGWKQAHLRTEEVLGRGDTWGNSAATTLVGGVSEGETDPLFTWQFDRGGKCPGGCEREEEVCVPSVEREGVKEEL